MHGQQNIKTLMNVCYTHRSLSDELKVEETPQKATALRLGGLVWYSMQYLESHISSALSGGHTTDTIF